MVYLTGDIHADPHGVRRYCLEHRLGREDIVVLLGDVGANFHRDHRDDYVKAVLNSLQPTVFCIHGNHEQRPECTPGYELQDWKGGKVWVQKEYPNVLFARDGDIFQLGAYRYLVIGGAYSVDKLRRVALNLGWWPDEQPSEETKAYVERQVREKEFDVILSHTCPYRYEPTEMFLPSIDQGGVDAGTEHWLDRIEQQACYRAWFCGHWHTDKRIDRMHFLYHRFETE